MTYRHEFWATEDKGGTPTDKVINISREKGVNFIGIYLDDEGHLSLNVSAERGSQAETALRNSSLSLHIADISASPNVVFSTNRDHHRILDILPLSHPLKTRARDSLRSALDTQELSR